MTLHRLTSHAKCAVLTVNALSSRFLGSSNLVHHTIPEQYSPQLVRTQNQDLKLVETITSVFATMFCGGCWASVVPLSRFGAANLGANCRNSTPSAKPMLSMTGAVG